MALKLECSQCKKNYTVESSSGGKQLACECGKIISIPNAPDDDGDWKLCPECESYATMENVICLECGHNFLTGKKTIADSGSTMSIGTNLWYTHGAAIRKLAILALVLGIGFWIYRGMTAKPHGMSTDFPLGRLEVMAKFLKELGFEEKVESAPKEYSNSKCYRYRNIKLSEQTKGTMNENIAVIADDTGKILALSSGYAIPTGAISATGTSASRFIRRMRNDLDFPEKPTFSVVTRGNKPFTWSENVYSDTQNGVTIYWTKIEHAQGLITSSHKIAFALSPHEAKPLTEYVDGADTFSSLFTK